MKRMSPWAYAHLLKAMEPGDLSCVELAEATGLCKLTVYHYAKALHQVGLCHISEWGEDKRGRQTLRIYKLGRGKDAKRTPQQSKERSKAWREKQAQIAIQRAMCGVTT